MTCIGYFEKTEGRTLNLWENLVTEDVAVDYLFISISGSPSRRFARIENRGS